MEFDGKMETHEADWVEVRLRRKMKVASSKTEKSGMRETGGKNWRREKETIETAKLQ